MAKKKPTVDALASNRKARHDYEVLETYEAGIELVGTEVKSCRLGHVSLQEAFAQVENGQLWIYQMTIEPYTFGNRYNHNTRRERRLLLHKVEIEKLTQQTTQKGLTLIPLKMYLKHGFVKVQIGLCRGKNVVDKRETLKRKTADMEMSRAIRNANHK
jgi:SsrA-binding protein